MTGAFWKIGLNFGENFKYQVPPLGLTLNLIFDIQHNKLNGANWAPNVDLIYAIILLLQNPFRTKMILKKIAKSVMEKARNFQYKRF